MVGGVVTVCARGEYGSQRDAGRPERDDGSSHAVTRRSRCPAAGVRRPGRRPVNLTGRCHQMACRTQDGSVTAGTWPRRAVSSPPRVAVRARRSRCAGHPGDRQRGHRRRRRLHQPRQRSRWDEEHDAAQPDPGTCAAAHTGSARRGVARWCARAARAGCCRPPTRRSRIPMPGGVPVLHPVAVPNNVAPSASTRIEPNGSSPFSSASCASSTQRPGGRCRCRSRTWNAVYAPDPRARGGVRVSGQHASPTRTAVKWRSR